MTRLLLFQKVESYGGPIFKVRKVLWAFSYLYLWHTIWFHAKKLLRALKFWKSLNLLYNPCSRPQKSPNKDQRKAGRSQFWLLVQKVFVPLLCIPDFSPFMAHRNISLCFRRVKYFHFSRICTSARKFFLSACCGLYFDATYHPQS